MKGLRTMKNGAVVLKEVAIPGSANESVVLCEWRGEFVVWLCAGLDCFYGVYSKDVLIAADAFKKKCATYGVEV